MKHEPDVTFHVSSAQGSVGEMVSDIVGVGEMVSDIVGGVVGFPEGAGGGGGGGRGGDGVGTSPVAPLGQSLHPLAFVDESVFQVTFWVGETRQGPVEPE
jgi:hypothetical protein